jgi:hypothetical protein
MMGYMKQNGLLARGHLHVQQSDALKVLLSAAGQNLRLIVKHLRMLERRILCARQPNQSSATST